MVKHALIGLGLFALVTPALADDYWVVQDTSTKRCTVVDKKPTTSSTVVVGGDGTVYKTREEADTAMKKVTVCEERSR